MPHEPRYDRYDLVVIGGGAAGMVAAAAAAGMGARTLLVERADRLGGECSWTGCVPSKALIHLAHVAHEMRRHGAAGAANDLAAASLEQTRRVTEEVARDTDGAGQLQRQGAEILFGGSARLAGRHRVDVNGRRLYARRAVVATGSRPALPDLPGLGSVRTLTNENLWSLPSPPRRLVILGAGPVGIEMAQAFRRLGTRVAVLSRGASILSKEDGELSAILAGILRAEGVELHPAATVKRVEPSDGGVAIHFEQGGAEQCVSGDELLIATGRVANVEGLGWEAVGVAARADGVPVSRRLRTAAGWVYVTGDLLGHHQFSHAAEQESLTAVRNAFFPLPARFDFAMQPWCTFTDPELAHLGPTERELQARGVRYRTWRTEFRHDDRARTDDAGQGMVKIITTPLGRILGAHILGPRAGELMNEVVLAVRQRTNVATLAYTEHIYPTLGLSLQRAGDGWIEEMAQKRWVRPALTMFTRRA